MNFIEIDQDTFDVEIDLKYSSNDNITGKKIFLENKCFLIEEAAIKLKSAVKIAKDLGFILKIFDAYRPAYVQEALWNSNPNPNFLTSPKKGSPHTRGIAVDLTLINKEKKEIDMGTSFDDFTEKAFHLSKNINTEIKKNRCYLLSIMTMAGFDHYLNEWWHYQLYNPKEYPLINNFFGIN